MIFSRHSRSTKARGPARYLPQSLSRLMPKLVSLLLLTWSYSRQLMGKNSTLCFIWQSARIMQSLKYSVSGNFL